MGELEQYHPRQTQARISARFEPLSCGYEPLPAPPPTRREKAVMWALFALVLVGCALYLWQAKGGPA